MNDAINATRGTMPISDKRFRVQRWRGTCWRFITPPLPQSEAAAKAKALKRTVSAFHLRLVERKKG